MPLAVRCAGPVIADGKHRVDPGGEFCGLINGWGYEEGWPGVSLSKEFANILNAPAFVGNNFYHGNTQGLCEALNVQVAAACA